LDRLAVHRTRLGQPRKRPDAGGEVITARLDYLRELWGGLVSIIDAAEGEFDAAECGLPDTGAILVRPDGFIGFRATPVDGSMVDAIHAHLETYLVPNVVGGSLKPRE
jgi:hypothetical protein